MRELKIIAILSIALLSVLSCSKEPAMEAKINLELLDSVSYINQRLSIVVSGQGDFCTFFNGILGKEYDSLPNARGTIVNFGDTIQQAYQVAGEYTVTAIASSYGNWGEESDRDIEQIIIRVEDNNTDIIRVFMTEPKYRLGTIDNDTIFISAGDIDLSNITLQVITVSQQAIIYPNSDRTVGYPGGEEFPGDYSNEDPHILIESPAGTTQRYPILFQ